MSFEPSIIVIGLGNPLRGDDGIGWYAIDRLTNSMNNSNIEFVKCRELLPEISEKISKAKYVLFIDAAVDTDNGEIVERQVDPAENYPSLETHQLDPAGILSFSKALYGRIPSAVMLTVSVESFEFHEGLSEKGHAGVELLVKRACEILGKWLGTQRKSCADAGCQLINNLD
jgi:hydrogenase maturation protease